ncbi:MULTISPECIES: hypothetical protein [unclassified Bradyrhizobium]
MSELSGAGIAFTEKGVEFRKWPPKAYVPTGIAFAVAGVIVARESNDASVSPMLKGLFVHLGGLDNVRLLERLVGLCTGHIAASGGWGSYWMKKEAARAVTRAA